MLHADGMFLPATAVDFSGNRIGQGGGYYDKFLAALAALMPSRAGTSDVGLLPPCRQPPSSSTARCCRQAASRQSPSTGRWPPP